MKDVIAFKNEVCEKLSNHSKGEVKEKKERSRKKRQIESQYQE